jgi:hypothetical protein
MVGSRDARVRRTDTRSVPTRRHVCPVLLLLVTSSATALASQATPVPDSDTKLYIGHVGGFTARIPADWAPDRSLDHDYAGRDGFIATVTTPSLDASQASHDTVCATTVADPDLMRQPVAVLIGPQSASAAVSVAIAFVDRDRAAFFGEPTAGPVLEPYWIELLDGLLMAITTGWMVGLRGAIYPDGIAPDVTVVPSTIVAPLADDPVVQEAMEWLREQPGCAPTGATPAADNPWWPPPAAACRGGLARARPRDGRRRPARAMASRFSADDRERCRPHR